MNVHKDCDLKPLVVAVIIRAAKEANEGSEEARNWMLHEASIWLDGVGIAIHPDKLTSWVHAGCKLPKRAFST